MEPLYRLADYTGPAVARTYRWPERLRDVVLRAAHPDALAVLCVDMLQTLWSVDLPADRPPTSNFVAADYVAQVSGGRFCGLPLRPSPGPLAYLQTRRFVQVDLARGEATLLHLSNDMEDLAERGAWLSDAPLRLAVEWVNTSDYHRGQIHTILRTYSFDGGLTRLGERRWTTAFSCPRVWDAGDGIVASIEEDAGLVVLDEQLRRLDDHALADAAAQVVAWGQRPFDVCLAARGKAAVIAAEDPRSGRGGLWSLHWDGDTRAIWRTEVPAMDALELIGLAPDGAWVLFLARHRGRAALFAQRIVADPTPPLLLHGAVPDSRVFLWLRDASVVMFDLAANTLHRWQPGHLGAG